MFDGVLTMLIREIPTAGALVLVIVLFLRATAKREALFTQRMTEISDDCHETQRVTAEAIRENTSVLHEMKGLLRSLNGRIS